MCSHSASRRSASDAPSASAPRRLTANHIAKVARSTQRRPAKSRAWTLSAPAYNADETAFTRKLQTDTLSADDIESASRSLTHAWRDPQPLFDRIETDEPGNEKPLYGSTDVGDVGDVSWVTPTAQCFVSCFAFGTPFHSWQLVAQGKTSLAHKGMLLAAKTLAASALESLAQPSIIGDAKAERIERRHGKPCVCPIPAEIPLPFTCDRTMTCRRTAFIVRVSRTVI
ncbi:peptidase M20D, amidohydrolase [Caballeronia peredens]|nr:peptidase M20D, amidohydrolase [Caballeronia peredens]